MKEDKENCCPYEEAELIRFEDGLFGFESYKCFLPLPITEDSDAVLNLLSVEDESLSFVIMNPFMLMKDYAPRLTEEIYEKLEADKETDLSYYVICVVGSRPEESTVNFKCPIVVNTVSRKAVQVILESEKYHFRHALKDLEKEEV
ncbi:flagellar assembly protein FliW [[Clostridium] hylemonae]|uniref:Flagellar assembly factor FliW n=1 Tax=[Clostridium] hylemonae DSM 15053 TaxID=553973 RepID=C0C1L0_9FIRM|nr:flagellar assembly protein FliW [[Clostridium] hylemonae]EEG74024.1 protein FliW [[Clostridium] hylemonae DSM 15053]QEK19413.1 Flagellar assembly factor FliW [[Clostridium] hylemonae DSM 15053]BDF06365.1 flagellar assembly factor FliW [[Clostridium] hylemonae]